MVKSTYANLTRFLPPFADHRSWHARAAVAAICATVKHLPGTLKELVEALKRAGTVSALAGLPRGSPGYESHQILSDAIGVSNVTELVNASRDDTARGEGVHTLPPVVNHGDLPESSDDESDADEVEKERRLDAAAKGLKLRWGSRKDKDAGTAANGAATQPPPTIRGLTKNFASRRWGIAVRSYITSPKQDASDAFKTMFADKKTISVDDVRAEGKVYIKKLKWNARLYERQGWFLASFVWMFGGYTILTYGVLIYQYLGPGEEDLYIQIWGMAFLINTFGLEALILISRKAFFIYVIGNFKNSFMKAAELLAWYETYTKMVGMHLLSQSGAYGEGDFKTDNADDGEGDGDDGD